MGRRKLVEGDVCRRGHAWNRTPDKKRCLTCYPLAEPRPLPAPKEPRKVLTCEERLAAKRLRERKRRNLRKEEARAGGRPFNSGALRYTKAAKNKLKEQNGRCGLTGLPLGDKSELDHIVPLSQGGTNAPENLHWTQAVANRAKGNMRIEEFRAWLLSAADSLRAKIMLEGLL